MTDNRQLAQRQPKDIDEALEFMEATLIEFHKYRDKRAIFLRLYYIMTLEVQAAIKGTGVYTGRTVFLDPEWIRSLSGRFASLYFRSLDTYDREPDERVERAWKAAYTAAGTKRSTVVQNALLGINAHILYDLPRALAANLDPGDLKDYATLQLRKFDHDQVNNLLIRVLNRIQRVLAHDYAPGIAIADGLLGHLDERLSEAGLRHYREGVWWAALAYAAATAEEDLDEQVVREKLNWESHKVAGQLGRWRVLWFLERALGLPFKLLRLRRWDRIALETVGGLAVDDSPVNPLR